MKGLQLPLGVQLADTASFATYYAGPNAEAVAALQATLRDGAPPLLLLFGPRASGKTHLLQALTRAASATRSCAYVPLTQLAGEDPADVLDGLESAERICLDDVDAVVDHTGWSLALLRLLDRLRAHGGHGVLSAARAPERMAAPLPDLQTRLAAAAVYGLRPLSDVHRAAFLQDRARARGLDLPADVVQLLLSRLPRDAGSLVGALDRLDRALLVAQRRPTVAFVHQWLRDLPAPLSQA